MTSDVSIRQIKLDLVPGGNHRNVDSISLVVIRYAKYSLIVAMNQSHKSASTITQISCIILKITHIKRPPIHILRQNCKSTSHMTLLQSIIVSIGLIHGLVLWLTAMPASVILKSMVYDRMSRCRDSRASRSRLIDPILLLQGYEKHMAPVIMLFFQILCGILVVKQLIGRYFGASSAQQLGKYCSLYMGRQCHVFLKVWKEQLSNVDCAWILADMLIVSAMQYYCRVLSCHVNDTEAPQVEGKNTQDRTYRTNLIDMWRQAELQILQKEDMKWKPPPMALTRALVAPLFWLWRPCVVGLDEAIHDLGIGEPSNEGGLSLSSSPSKPINSITGNIWSTFSAKRIREPYSSHCPTPAKILIVSNHAILGLEMPLLYQIWYERTGKFLRGLADHLHFYAPWKKCVQYFGAIHGSRQNVDALMAQGLSPLLVYPGGSPKHTINYA